MEQYRALYEEAENIERAGKNEGNIVNRLYRHGWIVLSNL